MNFPLMLVVGIVLGAAGGAISNVMQGHDPARSAKGGLATGVFMATVAYFWFIIVGSPLPIP